MERVWRFGRGLTFGAALGVACTPNAGGQGSGSGIAGGDESGEPVGTSTSTGGTDPTGIGDADGTGDPGSTGADDTGGPPDGGETTGTSDPTGPDEPGDSSGSGIEEPLMICSTPNLSLPDNDWGGVFDPIMVDKPGKVVEAWISVRETHQWVGDIGVRLHHDGQEPLLVFGVYNGNMNCGGDNIDVVLRDGAASSVQSTCDQGTPSISGERAPFEPLSVFEGMDAQGQWTLQTADMVFGYTGTLDEWCLMLRLQP